MHSNNKPTNTSLFTSPSLLRKFKKRDSSPKRNIASPVVDKSLTNVDKPKSASTVYLTDPSSFSDPTTSLGSHAMDPVVRTRPRSKTWTEETSHVNQLIRQKGSRSNSAKTPSSNNSSGGGMSSSHSSSIGNTKSSNNSYHSSEGECPPPDGASSPLSISPLPSITFSVEQKNRALRKLKELIERTLKKNLKDEQYCADESRRRCTHLSQILEATLKQCLNCGEAEYKIIAIVYIAEIRDDGLKQAFQYNWNPRTDYFAVGTYCKENMFATGVVFATLLDDGDLEQPPGISPDGGGK